MYSSNMHWIKISSILCMFGCFKDFRPSESFVTDYLTGPWKNFTSSEVNQDIYPVGTYSYAATLILVFLITDFARYKPIIILCGASGIITYILIIFGKTILLMQIVQFFYALFLSTEVAYYTYIYAKVDKKHYQEVTGHTKAASLFGRSISGIIAQLSASLNLLDYHQLNYLTGSAMVIATIWSLFLPSVSQSIYFHRVSTSSNVENPEAEKEEISQSQQRGRLRCCHGSLLDQVTRAYISLWKHFVQAYTNYRVLKWSIWWALSTCGYLQVINYSQLLWQTAVQPGDILYNGAVDFTYAIVGAITVFCMGRIRLNWALLGDMTLCVCAVLEAAILVASSYIYNIWLIYAGYVIFGVIYHTMVTVASFEVAKYISEDSYGLIFGMNMFFALVAQSLLTLVVVNTLMMDIRWQFFIYGFYFIVLATIYVVMGVINLVHHRRSGESFQLYIDSDNSDKYSPSEMQDKSYGTSSESANNRS